MNNLLARLREALERAREPRPTVQHYPGGLAGGLSPEDHQRLSEWQLRCAEARSEIVEALPDLLARIEALTSALEPFAALADRIRADDPDNDRPALARVADYRKARTALTAPSTKDTPEHG